MRARRHLDGSPPPVDRDGGAGGRRTCGRRVTSPSLPDAEVGLLGGAVASARPSVSPAASISSRSVASCTSWRSMIRLPNASSRSVPTIACRGTPAWRVRVPISPTSLPSSVCSSSLPSPVTTARAARMRASKPSASRTNGAPGSSTAPCAAHSPPLSPPAAPVIGTPRGSRGSRAASSSSRASSRATIAASAPFCGPNTAGARSNGVRTSDSTTIRAPPQAAVLLDRLERARAAVGRRRAADAEQHDLGARVDRRADQLAGAVGGRGPRVALVLGHEPEARRRGHLEHRRAAVLDQPERSAAAAARAGRARRRRASRRRARAAAPPSCPRRRRRAGTGRAA